MIFRNSLIINYFYIFIRIRFYNLFLNEKIIMFIKEE